MDWKLALDYGDFTTKIDALAARLGVKPEPQEGRSDGQMRYLVSVNNGKRSYNFLDLVHAFLDRLDQAAK